MVPSYQSMWRSWAIIGTLVVICGILAWRSGGPRRIGGAMTSARQLFLRLQKRTLNSLIMLTQRFWKALLCQSQCLPLKARIFPEKTVNQTRSKRTETIVMQSRQTMKGDSSPA